MSRSYRKPIATDGYGSKWKRKAKQIANRRVRMYSDLPDGSTFKRVSNSWDICDYKFNLEDTSENRSK